MYEENPTDWILSQNAIIVKCFIIIFITYFNGVNMCGQSFIIQPRFAFVYIKHENFLWSSSQQQFYIVDFGLAKESTDPKTEQHSFLS